ncbi:TonB-dependent siderophore receptor [Flavobacterium sp. HSC-61S13]|uniref:TonB-dependent receptor plug domain-containing protein n=1 Tax=Flavobacterium sp. HSC-61S13 TaxID=2910963 RepID=UPI0020A004E7|nr:TonB-dependent receptor [Flavobacterium sp. HSC-61S13]MCP1996551.1 iron complex outermembrane receptor protein [Flavobacterium sp. HSC-61S13]
MKHLKHLSYLSVSLFFCLNSFGQKTITDTLQPESLSEIVILQSTKPVAFKPLATLDSYLEQFQNVSLVKRGAYAWEPLINSMPTERTSLTIDGMHIFNACTDKMDPITSYVEINNLSMVRLTSGQQGSQHGPTIGGGMDLVSKKGSFSEEAQNNADIQSGYDSNNRQFILGGAFHHSAPRWYFDGSALYRNADNYRAGGNEEVLYSSYKKLNLASNLGYALNPHQRIEAAVIYDKATDVGYPALPMDVSLAEALITSIKLESHFEDGFINHWETKLYYNTITHRMDDTKRPAVPIHMDMPGWSTTYGLYSKLNGSLDKHQWTAQLNAYQNTSLAEMTMYPNNPDELSMFMYTWPDVHTFYTGLFIKDLYQIDARQSLNISGSLGNQTSEIKNNTALESMQIFYPNMESRKNRFLGNIAINYENEWKKWKFGGGLAYGLRAPSVSEAYGFYLFNSSDRYDYIGNPDLKNEKSLEANAYISYENNGWKSKLNGSFFHLSDYIIGKPVDDFIAMTIGADGVKRYIALDHAQIFTAQWMLSYQFTDHWNWTGNINYHYGQDSDKNNLPLISPLSYSSSLQYKKERFNTALALQGNALKSNFAPTYGEERTAAYAIVNINAGYLWQFGKQSLNLKTGIENILDTNYTTFADWNHIPRLGRNIFINLSLAL